jgi:FAD/FMN-containing dehydrogenase
MRSRCCFDLGVRQRPALAVLAATEDDIVVSVRLAHDHGLGVGAQATGSAFRKAIHRISRPPDRCI